MANFGDIALNLPQDWSRFKLHDKRQALMTVGHEDGVADAYLTEEPEARYQFAWVEPRYKDEVDMNRTRGYKFVTKSEWTKNEDLWEWDAEGYCLCMGQRLMARPAALFFADLAERQRVRANLKNRAEEEVQEIAERYGIPITGEDNGKPIARRRRA